jgi:hypothetical protein
MILIDSALISATRRSATCGFARRRARPHTWPDARAPAAAARLRVAICPSAAAPPALQWRTLRPPLRSRRRPASPRSCPPSRRAWQRRWAASGAPSSERRGNGGVRGRGESHSARLYHCCHHHHIQPSPAPVGAKQTIFLFLTFRFPTFFGRELGVGV